MSHAPHDDGRDEARVHAVRNRGHPVDNRDDNHNERHDEHHDEIRVHPVSKT